MKIEVRMIARTWNLVVLFIALSLQWISCTPEKPPLRLATYTYATNDRIENMRPLALALEESLQRAVVMRSYPDVRSFISAIKADSVDIALINTLGYLRLAADTTQMIPVANLQIPEDAVDNYKSVILTTHDSLRSGPDIFNLAGQLTMMFVSEGSTSGNLVPRLYLSAIGIRAPEAVFRMVKYGGNHTTTFEKLLDGEADLCAIGSNEYYKQLSSDSTLRNKTRAIWVSDEIPLGPILLNPALSSEEQFAISDLLLNLHTTHPDILESIKDGWSEAKQAVRFQKISDAYYNSFRMVNGSSTGLDEILGTFPD